MAANILHASPPANPAYLDLAPPHWAARGLAYAIIALVGLVTLGAIVIKVPDVVTTDFTIIPVSGADPVKAARGGVVSQVLISEGQRANQGDVLVTLRSDAAGDRSADLAVIQTQLAGAGESFRNASSRFQAEQRSAQQEVVKLQGRITHLDTMLKLKRQQLALTQRMADSYETLYREGIASQAQYTTKQIELNDLRMEIERSLAEQAEARATIDKLNLENDASHAEFDEVGRKLREDVSRSEIRAATLKTSLDGSDGSELRLTAPCAGTVLRLLVRDRGAVVQPGETVAEIACAGESLQAELMIPESGVGKLQMGQGVKLKYDAFPFQRFGVKYGRVSWLSPATVIAPEGAAFRGRVELEQQYVTLGAQRKDIPPGMKGKAEIVVGKRSLVSYVFEPLKQLKENFSDIPREK